MGDGPGQPGGYALGQAAPPEPYDGIWAQTVMADDWDELETELAAQAKYDAERLTIQAAHGLSYQPVTLVDHTHPLSLSTELSAWWSLLTASRTL